MASLTCDQYGYAIRFQLDGGKRHKVRLTGYGEERAQIAKHHVEVLLRAKKRQQPVPVATLDYLYHSSPANLQAALAACGALENRRMLGDAGRAWILTRIEAQVSANRIDDCERVMDYLVTYLGDRDLDSITPTQLMTWSAELEHAANTVAKYITIAKQFFRWCESERLVSASPAVGLRPSFSSSERLTEIPAEHIERLMSAADVELQLALALSRWGGLRAAEIFRIEHTDIDFDTNTFFVRETKRIAQADRKRMAEQGGYRMRRVPLFPQLRAPLLLAMRTHRGLLMPGLADLSHSGRTERLERLAAECGIELPERPWQNMRASRETELLKRYDPIEVCRWIGNSSRVATKHYAIASAKAFSMASEEG